jgi:hypothetical protein
MTTYYLQLGNGIRTETNINTVDTLTRKGWLLIEQPDPNTVWQNGAWVTVPEPEYTAEQWLDVQSFQDKRSTMCLYLKLQLDAANKTSPKLAAVQAWMDGIIAQGILNPDEAKSDWLPTPYTFSEATTEALQVLQA